jgi:transposase-like protein
MHICKFCGGGELIKRGFVRGKQRYFCKLCKRHHVIGDDREKYSEQVKHTATILYLEGCGFRRIERILRSIYHIKIHFQLVIHWMKNIGRNLEEKLVADKPNSHKIPLLEMDELYTYIKKKQIKSEYGLLLIETGCVLLSLKSETAAQKL